MKNYRLNWEDLFDNRIVFMSRPGFKRPLKVRVMYKYFPLDKNARIFLDVEGLNDPLMLDKLGLDPAVADIRIFAKEKQAARYCKYPAVPVPGNTVKSSRPDTPIVSLNITPFTQSIKDWGLVSCDMAQIFKK